MLKGLLLAIRASKHAGSHLTARHNAQTPGQWVGWVEHENQLIKELGVGFPGLNPIYRMAIALNPRELRILELFNIQN